MRRELPILNLQFAALSVRQFPHLPQQLKLLTDFLEDTAASVFPAGSEVSRKETAFALRYTVNEADIIPDSVPEIGYADDSLIVRTVLSRHQDVFATTAVFGKFAGRRSPSPLSELADGSVRAGKITGPKQ